MNNFTLKNLLLEDNFDDENTSVSWINNSTHTISNDNIENNDIDNNDDIMIETETSNINMNIIKDNNIKKVRITLEFNVKINDEQSKLISIDMDINKTMILKIAEELKD